MILPCATTSRAPRLGVRRKKKERKDGKASRGPTGSEQSLRGAGLVVHAHADVHGVRLCRAPTYCITNIRHLLGSIYLCMYVCAVCVLQDPGERAAPRCGAALLQHSGQLVISAPHSKGACLTAASRRRGCVQALRPYSSPASMRLAVCIDAHNHRRLAIDRAHTAPGGSHQIAESGGASWLAHVGCPTWAWDV